MNAEGHRRLAQAVLAGLGKDHDKNWRDPLPPSKEEKQNYFDCNYCRMDSDICNSLDVAQASW
jgi:hypothetical protein